MLFIFCPLVFDQKKKFISTDIELHFVMESFK